MKMMIIQKASMTQTPKRNLNNCVLFLTDGKTHINGLGKKIIQTKHSTINRKEYMQDIHTIQKFEIWL